MAEDATGTLWLADEKDGLGTLRNGSIVKSSIANVPVNSIYQMSLTRNGDLWLGYFDGGVTLVSGSTVRQFGAKEGLAAGTVQAIFEDHSGSIWIGTSAGLSRYCNGAWTTWTTRQGLPMGGVQGVIEDRSGRVWLITRSGIVGVADAPSQTHLTLATYGPTDGIRMREVAGRINPRVAMTADGRLWFGTEDGLASINPAALRFNHVPPPVEIEELVVDGKPAPFPRGGTEIHGRSVEVEYTALSLTSPETVRFRYMLEPVNRQWVDAKATRRMGFVNLGPGHYRFHVTACNNDGEWNPTGAALAFTIDPRFYQTWWFATLVVLSLVMAAYGAHRRRVYRLKSSFRLVLQERTRLTRELHDTLLQGFAGVVYQLEAASRQMTADPAAGKNRLDKALEQADQSLLEARQMLSCMRLSALEGRTLEEALRAAGEQITDGTPIRFELSVSGKARELPYEVQACLYIVGREAMNNAGNHARPDRIAVILSYGNNAVTLTVRDDGQGFDVESAGVKTDHWGLAGMRERAVQAGGSLKIVSSPGCGTTVEIVVENLSRKRAAASSP
jgi:signal transduction histidine kinase